MGLQLLQKIPLTGILDLAEQIVETEIAGLILLKNGLGPSFGEVVTTLLELPGRVIVTGMGKSGHVARKIAATFASTGTPAQFVHPGEASHGDMGMITPGDAVIALSNSGETPELADLIAYTRRFGIELIAMTSAADSSLAHAADMVLLLPQAVEACPLGLAPTTSTTMMLALGDALAVVMLEQRGFGRDDFRTFHPGGKLGRGLVRVSSLMHADNLPLAGVDTAVSDVILTMTAARFGCAGIVDDNGRLTGIVTDGDLRRHMTPTLLAEPASRIMTAMPQTIGPDALAAEALNLMTERERQITVLFVVKEGIPVGILHIHDLLRAGVM